MDYKTTAIIQLDKLVFSCTSTVEDNFNEAIKTDSTMRYTEQVFGATTLTPCGDMSHRYKHSYTVSHAGNQLGQIDFCPLGRQWENERLRFTVSNEVFYNGTQPLLTNALNDLFLQVENFSKIDVALDSSVFNFEQIQRRNLKNKDNQVRILHKAIKDRTETEDHITYFHKGSLNNPFKVRSISIKDKNETKEVFDYDKLEELEYSDKQYILQSHEAKLQKVKNLYRGEVRLKYDAVQYYEDEVIKRSITLEDLLNKNFLYNLYSYEMDCLIGIKDAAGKKVALYPPFSALGQ